MIPSVGRADLLRALVVLKRSIGADFDSIAHGLGYEGSAASADHQPETHVPATQPGFGHHLPSFHFEPPVFEQEEQRDDPSDLSLLIESGPREPADAVDSLSVPFWRHESVWYWEDDPPAERPQVEVFERSKIPPPRDVSEPALLPLSPWSWLWPRIHEGLAADLPSAEIDVDALVCAWSRGEILHGLPRKRRRCWARRLSILVDRDDRLMPFWADQAAVYRRLRRVCGRQGIDLRLLEAGPGSTAYDGMREPVPVGRPLEKHVLALSDLGHFGTREDRRAWQREARRLKRAGHRLVALVPCPPYRWKRPLARAWRALAWERGCDVMPADYDNEGEPRRRAEALLRLVSPAVRIEPGLLRAVQRLFPAAQADVGTLADAWLHEATRVGCALAITLAPEVRDAWRRDFPSNPLKEKALAEMKSWHAILPPEFWLEVTWTLSGQGTGDLLSGETPGESAWRLLKTLEHRDKAWVKAVTVWFRRVGNRLPERVWDDPQIGEPLTRTWARAHRDTPDVKPPVAFNPQWIEPMDPLAEPRTVWVQQTSTGLLRFDLEDHVDEEDPSWDVARLEVIIPELRLDRGAKPSALLVPGKVEMRPSAVTLWTDRMRATFGIHLQKPWASAIGRDRFGVWTAFQVGEVAVRLRWIPPGRFWMGSPEGEDGRRSAEGPQHRVTLTRGYWLAETPCTQALWQVVMGDNPSEFKSPDRPVENVSWDDSQRFLERLGEQVPGLEPRLPSEAEWEYACRAGTTTSSYAGEVKILGENNAPVLDAIAWYGGNSGVDLENGWDSSGWSEKQYDHDRAGTHPVARKQPNPWGLYDMLGNVWEWCADRWADDYTHAGSIDPPGPATGQPRVVRGGTWISVARVVRAAYRNWGVPGGGNDDRGFRLARGQDALRQKEAEPTSSVREAEPTSGKEALRRSRRGTSLRSRGDDV